MTVAAAGGVTDHLPEDLSREHLLQCHLQPYLTVMVDGGAVALVRTCPENTFSAAVSSTCAAGDVVGAFAYVKTCVEKSMWCSCYLLRPRPVSDDHL